MEQVPFVSVVVPCRNEARFISRCLNSIIANDYPKDRCEVLVIDGGSDDDTREIVRQYADRYPFVRLLHNPRRITAAAFNIGAREARGDVVLIAGAHATYDNAYIRLCIRYLQEYGADNVGGVLRTLPRTPTPLGRALALALSHPFGVGNSTFRTGTRSPVWTGTVFGGCYRREVFARIGYWNEDLVYSQDLEFNRRLAAAGGKILLVPEIVSDYYARSDLAGFIQHTLRNGVWAVLPFRFSGVVPVCWRQLVPGLFVAALLASGLISLVFPKLVWTLLALAGCYIGASLAASIAIAARESAARYVALMPLAFGVLHVTYGLGSVWGLLRLVAGRARTAAQ